MCMLHDTGWPEPLKAFLEDLLWKFKFSDMKYLPTIAFVLSVVEHRGTEFSILELIRLLTRTPVQPSSCTSYNMLAGKMLQTTLYDVLPNITVTTLILNKICGTLHGKEKHKSAMWRSLQYSWFCTRFTHDIFTTAHSVRTMKSVRGKKKHRIHSYFFLSVKQHCDTVHC